MKNRYQQLICALSLSLLATTSFAAGSVQHVSQGSSQIVRGSANIAVGSAYSAATAVAVPLVSIGVVGGASGAAGSAILNHSVSDHNAHKPLPLTERVIACDPAPNAAIE